MPERQEHSSGNSRNYYIGNPKGKMSFANTMKYVRKDAWHSTNKDNLNTRDQGWWYSLSTRENGCDLWKARSTQMLSGDHLPSLVKSAHAVVFPSEDVLFTSSWRLKEWTPWLSKDPRHSWERIMNPKPSSKGAI